jgi:hypothetical protein
VGVVVVRLHDPVLLGHVRERHAGAVQRVAGPGQQVLRIVVQHVLVEPRVGHGRRPGGRQHPETVTALALGHVHPDRLALLSAAAMGAYLIFASKVTANDESGLALAIGIAALLGIPAGLWQNGPALLSPGLLLAGAGVTVLSAVLPYSLEQRALRRLRHGRPRRTSLDAAMAGHRVHQRPPRSGRALR